ncbi:MAG: ZIP family metal transporter [Pseudomonadota bacterium]|nr:ZIP family metal transporter [Pseudomonadota bacterium]
MNTLVPIITFSLLAGLVSVLAAAAFLLVPDRVRAQLLPHLVSLATGALLGAAFLGLLPEALKAVEREDAHLITLCVLFGLVLFFLLEKMVIWRHCHEEQCERHSDSPNNGRGLAAGTLILLGDGIHNFVDGILIATAFLADYKLGVLTSLAVAAHEIPQEVGDFAILLQSGYTRREAFGYNLAVSLATVAGALVAWVSLAGITTALPYVLAVAAASFIYVAVADLIPGLHQRTELRESMQQVFLMSAGIGLVYGLSTMLH